MTCDFLYRSDTYYSWCGDSPKKASLHDINHGEVARCGEETDDEYINFEIDGVSYPIDLCHKHKNSKITREMVLENDNLLTSGRNFT